MPMTSEHLWENQQAERINDLEAYMDSAYERHLENQAMHIAGIKGRFHHLNIQWTPEIEKEAMRRDGGGITAYLRKISEDQHEEFRKRLDSYGAFS